MVSAVLDTCILIDHLNGMAEARDELLRYTAPMISSITWMEVMAGAPAEAESATRAFLSEFALVAPDAAIAEVAVRIRREERIRLPDAVIAATAEVRGALFVTRNTRDLDESAPGIRIPYRL